jgi:hypothetical protein
MERVRLPRIRRKPEPLRPAFSAIDSSRRWLSFRMPTEVPVTTEHIRNIRMRPGMYIGPTDSKGIEHLAGELIANSLDQFLAGKVSRIAVQLHGARISVSDDGSGFDWKGSRKDGRSLAEHYLIHYHNTPTADGHAPHIHLTSQGVGLVLVNAPHFNASVDAGLCFVHAAAAGVALKTQWQSWVNGQPTSRHGTHVAGFRSALRTAGWEPEFAAVHVVMREPRFAAPTRDTLCVEEVRPVLRRTLLPLLRAMK